MIHGNAHIVEWLLHASAQQLPVAMLCEGPLGVGKASLVKQTVARLCQAKGQSAEEALHAIDNGLHPDCCYVYKPEGARWITVEHIQKMVDFTQRSAVMGTFKYVIIDALDDVHYTARDAMLKCLEDAENVRFFLVAHRPKSVTMTIRSRAHMLTFGALSYEEFRMVLQENSCDMTHGEALYTLSGGSPGLAHMLLAKEGVVEACLEFFLVLHGIVACAPGHEKKLSQIAGQKQWVDYATLVRLCENVAAFVSKSKDGLFLQRNWRDFSYFFFKMRPVLHESALYHAPWKSFLWGIYGMSVSQERCFS